MGKKVIKVGHAGLKTTLACLAYLCLSSAMLYVVWQDFSGDRVLVLPGRGDSRDLYLYWRDSFYLCWLVTLTWLSCALLLLAGIVTILVQAWKQRRSAQ